MIMVPIAQVTDGYNAAYANIQPLFWVVRTHGDPHRFIPAISEQLRIASAGFPVGHIRTMDEVMGRSMARQNFNMLLLTIFGAVALLLAAIGIYGLMAYSVARRTQEMGIRMALGADRDAIRKLVVWQGMRLTLVGVLPGIAASFGLTRLLSTFLFGVSPGIPRSSYRRHSFSPRLRCSPCGCLPRAPPRSIPCKRCARSNADMAIVVRSAQTSVVALFRYFEELS
jgi:ABC-type antimicrobial peptide transport system permease subunit